MAARAHVIFTGRVQGVFFRAFTEETARSMGLTGWVRNLSDGSVEAVFEGEREDIEGAIAACRRGPEAAHVEGVSLHWQAPSGEFSTFSTRFR